MVEVVEVEKVVVVKDGTVVEIESIESAEVKTAVLVKVESVSGKVESVKDFFVEIDGTYNIEVW